MITRKQYLEDSNNLHRKYYAQFVNDEVKARVFEYFSVETLKKSFSKDEHFNDKLTPLKKWDLMAGFVFSNRTGKILQRPVSTEPIKYNLLKETGEGYSSSTGVSIYKEAARQLIVL